MIGILYESDEWSDHKLAAELEKRGCAARLINMEEPDNLDEVLSCDLLVNRIFASAGFRGHGLSLERMPETLYQIAQKGIPIINPAQAHFFETDKKAAAEALKLIGLSVPQVYACARPSKLKGQNLAYPCVIKPNCGGRSLHTTIAKNPLEARALLDSSPNLVFIVEEYIEPEKGFITRVEVIGSKCVLILKRSIAANGLSTYHFGSTYEPYPQPAEALLEQCVRASERLLVELGSFDIIENGSKYYFIDANAVSNVSEDCTALFDFDLMSAYAEYIAGKNRALMARNASLTR
jgi:ribosomal protein S6--L-glutamate ligase